MNINKTIKTMRVQLAVAIVITAFAAIAFASLNWHTTNQATIAWDAITELSDGSPIPSIDKIEYVVHLANSVTDPNKTNPVEVWRGDETQATITLNTEGQYYVGIQAVRKREDSIIATSTIGWSDNPQICLDGNTFGIQFFLPPKSPVNLRPA